MNYETFWDPSYNICVIADTCYNNKTKQVHMISFFYIHQTIKNSVGKTVSFHTVTSKSIGLMKVDLKFTSIRNDCTTAKDIVT